jgi:prophage antirepressor-like protein
VTSQNKKVFEDADENFLEDNIDECENDDNHDANIVSTFLEPMKGQPNFEINHFFNELPIRILNSHEMPFFYAEDIAKVLGIKTVRMSVKNFDENEIVSETLRQKYNIITYQKYKKGVRRNDKMILLTEFGVYRLLLTTRSEKSAEFKTFIYNVLYQLRTKGEYKVNQKLEQLQTVNEQLQAKVGKLEYEIDTLKHKQNQFKNLCDKLYLIEFPHDPYLIKQKVPKVLMKKSKLAKARALEISPALQELAAAKPNENVINDPVPFALILAQKLNLEEINDFINVENDASSEEIRLAHEANV